MSEVYPVGSIVKVYGSIFIKTTDKVWDAYNVEYEWTDGEATKYFEKLHEHEIEVLRKPTPKDTLRALPVGSVVMGGLYGAVATKLADDAWAVSLQDREYGDSWAASYLSESGDIRVLYRGDEA